MKLHLSFIVGAALLLAGCGGGGGSTTPVGPAMTKDQILASLSLFNDLKQPGGASGANRPKALHAKFAGSVLGPLSKPQPRGASEVWYDDSLGLYYVEFMEGDTGGDHTWGKHYFVDQEMTQPGGDDIIHSRWDLDPETDDEVMDITAGSMAGMHIEDHTSFSSSTGEGHENGSGKIPGQPDYEFTMSWTDGGYATIDEKFTFADKSWTRYQTGPANDGSNYIVTTSAGVKMDLHFGFEYDGTGTITGPGEGLPATIDWDTQGAGTIHWSDGTTTTFENWSIFS